MTEKIIRENAFEHKKKKRGLNLTWVLTSRNQKGTYNKIPSMEIIVIIIPKVSAVQCNILDITFFPAVILTLHIGQGRQLTSCYKSQSQPFPQFSQSQNI